MALSKHQEEVQEKGLDILQTSNRLLIKGSAGVGKTYMVDDLIGKLAKDIPRHKAIYCSAPTNKAVSVLAGKITTEYKNLSLITIHSAMKIGARIDKNTGLKSFEPILSKNPKYNPLVGVALLIIDESSMIGEKMLSYIEEHAKINKTTVIFIGDDKQINPVGEDDSPAFMADYPEVELTQIVRQGEGNPIIRLSRNLSAIWERETRINEDGKGFVYTIDRERIINELAAVNGSDDLKYLAWTNAEVDKMNSEVRTRIYGDPKKIELGESLIFDEPYQDFYTNQEVKVETLNIVNIPFKLVTEDTSVFTIKDLTLKCYVINGRQIDEWGDNKLVWKGIFIIHEDAEVQFAAVCKLLKINALNKKLQWATKFHFEGLFANIKYNHAISIHKSQGSTYKQVILDVGNVNRNPNIKEKQRLFYTGVTRASDLLILYNV